MLVDGQGRILLGAMTDGEGINIKVWRMLEAGPLDTTWSGDGVRVINQGGVDWFEGLAVDTQNRVLVGSDLGGPGLIYRLRPNGAFDNSFSGDGLATFRLEKGAGSFPLGIEVGSSGAITVPASGWISNSFGAVRMLDDGSLDPSYGDGGVVSVNCRGECLPTWGAVSGGRVAVVVDPYSFDGDPLRLARISPHGERVEQMSVNPFQKRQEEALAVALDGHQVVFGGGVRNLGAYAARTD